MTQSDYRGIPHDELEGQRTGYRHGPFDGKVALMSGAGSGIGKATAWLLSRLGARVVICGRDGSKSVAVEWAPDRIQVNCVAPGVIETPMLRLGDPFDIAEACMFLGSDMKFITGDVTTVDGGSQLWGDLSLAGVPEYFKPPPQDDAGSAA